MTFEENVCNVSSISCNVNNGNFENDVISNVNIDNDDVNKSFEQLSVLSISKTFGKTVTVKTWDSTPSINVIVDGENHFHIKFVLNEELIDCFIYLFDRHVKHGLKTRKGNLDNVQ